MKVQTFGKKKPSSCRLQATNSGIENQASGLSVTGKGQKTFGKKPNFKGSKGPKPSDICNYCKEPGHWKFDCPKQKMQKKDKIEDAHDSATMAEAYDINTEEDLVLFINNQTHCKDMQVLDSGVSYHISSYRELFSTYEQINEGDVSMANRVVCKVVGLGSIKLRTRDGTFCTLNKVRHVPQMMKNLISLTRIDSNGFSFEGKGGVMSFYKDSKVVLKGIKHGTLYLLQGSVIVASSEIHRSDESLTYGRR